VHEVNVTLPAAPPGPNDAARLARLKATKRTATGLLVLAAVVYTLARLFEARYTWVGFIRATAEASVVGGLADWFAVTALFRRPLGLPIPHTAIVTTQQGRIGRVLGNFVQSHFLSHDAVAAELRAMRLSQRIVRWMSEPANGERIAHQIVAGLAQTIEALPPSEVRDLIRQSALERVQAMRIAPVLGNVLALVTADNRHQELLDDVLTLVAAAIEDNRVEIRRKIREQSPWWVPGIVDETIYRKILLAVEDLLREVRANPVHPLRGKYDAALATFIERLKTSPDAGARAEALKSHLLAEPVVEELAASLWDAARKAAARYRDDLARRPVALGRGISAAAESLLESAPVLSDLDEFLIRVVASAAEEHRHEVAEVIAHAVSAWDPDVAVRRLELAVGPDLQYIRMNGTLVGGLVGLLIHTVAVLTG
jgi:uncharacterized membrane-anchored protein YjiN (DUF445 family)